MGPNASDKPVIGLVGGVGAGKSTVAAELARLGCALIDADRIGHDVLNRPDVITPLCRRWGEALAGPDGQIDRDALGEIVFAAPEALAELNEIVHPLIRAEGERQLADCLDRPDVPAVVIDAPLLVEAGWDSLCTVLVFVRSEADHRRRRVASERGWDEKKWQGRECFQISLDTKAGMCDYTIDNTSSVSHLVAQTRELFYRIVVDSDQSRRVGGD